MNVKRLKELLENLPDDLPVMLRETRKCTALNLNFVDVRSAVDIQTLDDDYTDSGDLMSLPSHFLVLSFAE